MWKHFYPLIGKEDSQFRTEKLAWPEPDELEVYHSLCPGKPSEKISNFHNGRIRLFVYSLLFCVLYFANLPNSWFYNVSPK